MTLSADHVQLLHCEADRLRSVAVGEGGELPVIPVTQAVTDEYVHAIAAVGAYALTMWELDLLRTLGHVTFDATYEALRHFVAAPTRGALETYGLAFAALFAGASDRRGVPNTCSVTLSFPGLSPPDPRILPQNLTDDGDIPQPGGEIQRGPIPTPLVIAGVAAAMFGVAAAIHFGR